MKKIDIFDVGLVMYNDSMLRDGMSKDGHYTLNTESWCY